MVVVEWDRIELSSVVYRGYSLKEISYHTYLTTDLFTLRVGSYLLDEANCQDFVADWNHNNVFYLPLRAERNKHLRILIPNPLRHQDQK